MSEIVEAAPSPVGSPSAKKKRKNETYMGIEIHRPWVEPRVGAPVKMTSVAPVAELGKIKAEKVTPETVARQLELVVELEAQLLGCGSTKEQSRKVAGCSRHLLQRRMSHRHLAPDTRCSTPAAAPTPPLSPTSPKKVVGCSARLLPQYKEHIDSKRCRSAKSKFTLDELVDRLYTQPVQRHKGIHSTLKHKYTDKPDTHSKRKEEERQMTVQRLFDDELSTREARRTRLMDKYTLSNAKVMTVDAASAVARLHTAAVQNSVDAHKKLCDSYITSRGAKSIKLPEKKLQEVSARLNSGGK